ncbi:MAG: hypothetical protein NPIRA02_11930 [Nitrospirales bacterium]|nr:MAG: hypothetical protein NPIRA02_11930 [Nitrospirales bacterium]
MPISGSLAPCPNSPNCVSSQEPDTDHYIEPLIYSGSHTGAQGRLRTIVERQPRMRIVTDKDGYFHIEVTSRIFGFIDDLEFQFDYALQCIHVRSASRTGYWDLGVNRKRIETIRTHFLQSS